MKQFFIVKRLLLLMITGLLSSCGFHLRGSIPLPKELSTLYIQSEQPFGQFEQVLRETLRTYKINIVTAVNQAPIILNILSAHLNQSAGAVSSDLQTCQYTLSYVVTYNVLSKTGSIILPTESVSSTTTFTMNLSKMMTSSNNTTAQYLPTLQRDAVARMIFRLTSDNSHTTLQHYFQKSMPATHENQTRTT